MPQIDNQLWNELRSRTEKYETQERDGIRRAVAASEAPLPVALREAVISLHSEHMHTIMREHRGFSMAERRNSYLNSLAIMEQCLHDLLAAIRHFEEQALTSGSSLFDRNKREALEDIERRIQKELFATANAAASLVDHSRRAIKCIEISDYDNQRLKFFGTDGLHELVIDLRVMMHHLHIVKSGWKIETNFSERTKTATFTISKASLLRVIAEYPKRFEKHDAMKARVNNASDKIDLRAMFLDYQTRINNFHEWMRKQLKSDSLIALRDYDNIITTKKKYDSRILWSALLGNWLNWKTSPDPHNHLHRYLTPEQLIRVYELPRNSKAQVDLVINYVDTDQAIDDNLRALIYRLFERSLPLLDATSTEPPL